MIKRSSPETLGQFQPNWQETCLGDGDSDCSNKGSGHFWGPIRGKIRKILVNLKKSSSREQLARIN